VNTWLAALPGRRSVLGAVGADRRARPARLPGAAGGAQDEAPFWKREGIAAAALDRKATTPPLSTVQNRGRRSKWPRARARLQAALFRKESPAARSARLQRTDAGSLGMPPPTPEAHRLAHQQPGRAPIGRPPSALIGAARRHLSRASQFHRRPPRCAGRARAACNAADAAATGLPGNQRRACRPAGP